MSIDLIQIAPDFKNLLDKNGFEQVDSAYNLGEFGNVSITMKSFDFSLRFYTDRGDIFVDIGGEKIGWYKLEYVIEFIDMEINDKYLGSPPDIKKLANAFNQNYAKIRNLFCSDFLNSGFVEFHKKKSVEFINNIFGTP